jgi:hypothetical protein
MKAIWHSVDSDLLKSWPLGVGRSHNRGKHFYTPVFRRDVLWYGNVCMSVRPFGVFYL